VLNSPASDRAIALLCQHYGNLFTPGIPRCHWIAAGSPAMAFAAKLRLALVDIIPAALLCLDYDSLRPLNTVLTSLGLPALELLNRSPAVLIGMIQLAAIWS